MTKSSNKYLSPREQQIMDIIYQREQTSVTQVMAALPDTLSNSAVRTHLRLLEGKGHLQHVEVEGKFLYFPVRPRQNAARTALSRLLATFFDGSVEKVLATLLTEQETDLSREELDRLRALIDEAREKGR